ncbi:MAG TPA: hypothetical protein VF733_04880 [Candidatus Saccharimonadales bacterium]
MAANLRLIARHSLFGLLAAVLATTYFMANPHRALALQLPDRSLYIQNSQSGATTSHVFRFSYASSAAVGSVVLEYCTDPFLELTCDAPSGIDASGAVLADQTGETGYSILDAQANRLVLTRAPATPTGTSSYSFDTIVNPTGNPDTFYVRISTYASSDGSGSYIDYGAVVNSTTTSILVSSEVPPILKFCVGLTLGDDCSTANESIIDLGDLSTARAARGTSQMIAATNAEFGLAIGVYGTTMTSGNNTIRQLDNPTVNAPGNAQFGLNLRQNTDPPIGANPTGVGITTPTGRYNIPNRYAFVSGDTVATSSAATDNRKFTVSYIVNVPPDQAPGVYTATLTYVCAATF